MIQPKARVTRVTTHISEARLAYARTVVSLIDPCFIGKTIKMNTMKVLSHRFPMAWGAAALALLPFDVQAQAWPAKPIPLVVAYTPGGDT